MAERRTSNNKLENRKTNLKLDINRPVAGIIRRTSSGSLRQELKANKYLKIGNLNYACDPKELVFKRKLGEGSFGIVEEREYQPDGIKLAVKRIRIKDKSDRKLFRMDYGVCKDSYQCPYIVDFYGAFMENGEAWLCMELMEASLYQLYVKLKKHDTNIPEECLRFIAFSATKALNYLHKELKVIHRDIKPANILINRNGNVKLCDFGISGKLKDSLACSRDAGCRMYMAPERIEPPVGSKGYDIRSDVWSLGITMIELATNEFPFTKCRNVFEQIDAIMYKDVPKLPAGRFSRQFEFEVFVARCLKKDFEQRPKYEELLKHPFLQNAEIAYKDMEVFITEVIDKYASLI